MCGLAGPWSGGERGGETAFPERVFSETALFVGDGVDKDYVNLGEEVWVLGVSVRHWLGLRRWESFICMERNSTC